MSRRGEIPESFGNARASCYVEWDGETIEITDRGRPVAVLALLPEDPAERLRASGDLQDSERDFGDLVGCKRARSISAGATGRKASSTHSAGATGRKASSTHSASRSLGA
jgi:antitoxin (DNA-binding transcriptional repressor) of toxin-antitoxin stability system